MPIIPYRVLCIGLAGLLLSGCISLLHPQAEEWYHKAEGATERETALTLIGLMETTARQAKDEKGEASGLETLHSQFHALHESLDRMSGEQTAAAGYEFALTLHEEVRIILHRLWKLQKNPSLRDMHLQLFLSRLQDLRKAAQTIPA